MRANIYFACATILLTGLAPAEPPQPDPARDYEAQVVEDVEGLKKRSQVMNDMVFSFGELGFQEFETSKYLTGVLEKEGFKVERGICGHPDGVDGDLGVGQAGDRARVRHRLHPPGLAEAGRRPARPDGRGRARSRRRAQLGPGPEHHRRDRGQAAHGAAPGSPARSSSGRGWRRSCSGPRPTSCATGTSRTSTSSSSRTSAITSASRGGRATRPAWCPSSTRSRARARTRAPPPGGAAARSTRSSS